MFNLGLGHSGSQPNIIDPCDSARYLESLQSSVVGVHHELGQGGELGGAVPAVAAVHQRAATPHLYLVHDPSRSLGGGGGVPLLTLQSQWVHY